MSDKAPSNDERLGIRAAGRSGEIPRTDRVPTLNEDFHCDVSGSTLVAESSDNRRW